jgi:hypothetical protein
LLESNWTRASSNALDAGRPVVICCCVVVFTLNPVVVLLVLPGKAGSVHAFLHAQKAKASKYGKLFAPGANKTLQVAIFASQANKLAPQAV